MIKQLLTLLLFFCILESHSQKIEYKSNGNIFNSENKKISPDQVRELLKNNEKLLANYNAGRAKKTVGNVLIISGSVFLVVGTFTYALSGLDAGLDPEYNGEKSHGSIPKTIALAGLAELLIAIPVKIGFSKKIKNVVTDYNNLQTTGYNKPKLDLITNSNGIGLRLTLN